MTTPTPSGTRRGLLARLTGTAAAAGAAAVLPGVATATPAAAAAPATPAVPARGYRETERVRTCYRLARY